MPNSQLLTDLRAARRPGGKPSPRLSVYLQTLVMCWRADPSATDTSFDAWCESLGTLKPRMTTLASSVLMALVDPRARYVAP